MIIPFKQSASVKTGTVSLVFSFLILAAATGWAGWTVPLELTDHSGQSLKKYPLTLLITDAFLKVDTSVLMSEGEKAELLYPISDNRIYYLLHHLRTCIVIDEQSVAGLSANLNQLTAFLDQQLGTRLSRQPNGTYRIQSRNGTKTIGNLICHGKTVWQNSTKIQEIWFTSWSQAGIRLEDLKPLQHLLSTADRIRSDIEPVLPLGEWGRLPIRNILTSDGYPVLIQQINGQSVRQEASFGKPKRNSLTAKDFQIPPGYQKKDLLSYLIEAGLMK